MSGSETYQKTKNKLRLISVSRSFGHACVLIILMVILVLGLISLLSASHAYSYYWNRGDSYFYKKADYICVGGRRAHADSIGN